MAFKDYMQSLEKFVGKLAGREIISASAVLDKDGICTITLTLEGGAEAWFRYHMSYSDAFGTSRLDTHGASGFTPFIK